MIVASTTARCLANRWQLGLVLFLAGIFLMMTGDWPPSTLHGLRWARRLDVLARPWLYLALLTAALLFMSVGGTLRVGRRATTDFLHRPLALLAVSFLLSVIFSQVPSLSWFAFGCVLAILGFSLGAARILEDETALGRASTVIALAALFLALRVIVWRIHEGLNVPAFHIRNNAWLGKLQIAWVLNLLAPLLLVRFIAHRGLVAAVLFGSAWLLTGTAINVLFSRTGSLTFALTTLSLCALNPHYWRRSFTLLTASAALALVLISLSGTMSTYVATSLGAPERDPGFVMRQGVWKETLRMIVDHPVTGIGLGTYDDVAYSQYGTLADRHFFRNGWQAHNVLLNALAETGALGFLAWCYLWFTIVRVLLKRWRHGDAAGALHSTAALCVILAFFVLSLTEDIIAARVHASLRMSLTLGFLVVYSLRLTLQTE